MRNVACAGQVVQQVLKKSQSIARSGDTLLILTSSFGAAPAWDVNDKLSNTTVTRPLTKVSSKDDSAPRTSVTGGPPPVSEMVIVVLIQAGGGC